MLQAFGRMPHSSWLDPGRYEELPARGASARTSRASASARGRSVAAILGRSGCRCAGWGAGRSWARGARGPGRARAGSRDLVPYRIGAPRRAPRGGRRGRRRGGGAHRRRPRRAAATTATPTRSMVLGELALAADAAGQAALAPRAGRGGGRDRRARSARLVPRPRGALSARMHVETPLGATRGWRRPWSSPSASAWASCGAGASGPRAGAARAALALRAGPPGRRGGALAAPSAAARCCTRASSGRRPRRPGAAGRRDGRRHRRRPRDASGCCSSDPVRARGGTGAAGCAWSAARASRSDDRAFGGPRLRAGDRVPDSSFGRAKARALMGALVGAEPAASTATRCWSTSGPSCRPSGRRARSTPRSTSCAARSSRWRRRARAARWCTEGEVFRLASGRARLLGRRRLPAAGPGGGRARRRGASACSARRRSAGDFLPDFPYEPLGGRGARAELERARLELLERLARALAEMGRPRGAIERYRHLVQLDRSARAGTAP